MNDGTTSRERERDRDKARIEWRRKRREREKGSKSEVERKKEPSPPSFLDDSPNKFEDYSFLSPECNARSLIARLLVVDAPKET